MRCRFLGFTISYTVCELYLASLSQKRHTVNVPITFFQKLVCSALNYRVVFSFLHRVVFEPAVREVTKTVLRGVQRCCKGWKGIRCDESMFVRFLWCSLLCCTGTSRLTSQFPFFSFSATGDESEEGPTEVSWEGPLNKKRQLAGSGSASMFFPRGREAGNKCSF